MHAAVLSSPTELDPLVVSVPLGSVVDCDVIVVVVDGSVEVSGLVVVSPVVVPDMTTVALPSLPVTSEVESGEDVGVEVEVGSVPGIVDGVRPDVSESIVSRVPSSPQATSPIKVSAAAEFKRIAAVAPKRRLSTRGLEATGGPRARSLSGSARPHAARSASPHAHGRRPVKRVRWR
jgi:hypothetical protein